jgi:hypothetical protein
MGDQVGEISAGFRSASPGNRAVDVRTRASDGTRRARGFHQMVFCPRAERRCSAPNAG